MKLNTKVKVAKKVPYFENKVGYIHRYMDRGSVLLREQKDPNSDILTFFAVEKQQIEATDDSF